MNKTKENLPAYVLTGVGIITSLVGFIFLQTNNQVQKTVDAEAAEISANKALDAQQETRITVLENDNQYLKKGMDTANTKLDKILNKF